MQAQLQAQPYSVWNYFRLLPSRYSIQSNFLHTSFMFWMLKNISFILSKISESCIKTDHAIVITIHFQPYSVYNICRHAWEIHFFSALTKSWDSYHQGFFSKNTLCSDAYLQHVLLDNVTNHNNSYYAKILQTVIHKLSFYTN